MFEYVTGPICIIELCVIATNVYAYCRGCYVDDKKKPLVGVQCDKLRRFALAFIHSHSGATGVFRNAFMEKKSRRRLPVYQKHCRRHREFYCC